MKISTNTIKFINEHYGSAGDPAPNGSNELAIKIGAQLGGIDEIIDYGSKFDGAVIVRIVSCEKHPNADKLNVCMIDDGGKTEGVDRNEDGLVQVVCGAPNVRAGLQVVWLPPDSTVPESVGKEPFVLGKRELRGVVSNGMLASQRELALGDSHDGILEIGSDSDESIAPGTSFVEAYNLKGDVIFDIENKMFTHRPDCFGFLGVAREIEGISHRAYKSPELYRTDVTLPEVEADLLQLEVRNEIPELVPRFTAITMRDVEVKPSPLWLQIDLAKHGIRSINNIVDYTNFFMLETGQPLHAYDYDKVKALDGGEVANIVIRHPQPGEIIMLLNGKEVEPRAESIMIATANKLIGIGGVMGGADTEVDETTRNIIIEVANFDMYSIRRTSMAHGLFTDAVTRFNKGQSPLQNRAVIAKIVDEIRRFANGKVAGQLIDDIHLPEDMLQRNAVHPAVAVTVDFINQRLGLRLSADEMKNLLSNVEFDVQADGDNLAVKAPFWRTDIEIPEDVVEEVGRLYGFDRLPLELPTRPMTPAAKNPMLELKQQLRETLSRAGANEVLTYSFVHGKLLDAAGQKREDSYQLSNALSPDLQYFRQSLTPSLLDKVHANVKAGYDEFALYEIGKGHVQTENQADEPELPYEFERLAVVYAADAKAAKQYDGAAYYQAKRYFESIARAFGLTGKLEIKALDSTTYEGTTQSKISYYEPGRAAIVQIDDIVIGEIGEYKVSARKALKLPEYSAGFEIDLTALAMKARTQPDYHSLSRFPKVEQDLCLKVDANLPYQQLYDFVLEQLEKDLSEQLRITLSPVDIYQRQDDPGHKQITLRLSVVNYAKTMRDSEVAAMMDDVAQAAQTTFGAEKI
jgi:phenylalanyl-tRNA synthetase beta chain